MTGEITIAEDVDVEVYTDETDEPVARSVQKAKSKFARENDVNFDELIGAKIGHVGGKMRIVIARAETPMTARAIRRMETEGPTYE